MLTVNGLAGKPPKLKTISSTGKSHSKYEMICFLTIGGPISLGERYGLRIIPGANSFLVLPNNISRSTAVGAILHPGGPARPPSSYSILLFER